MSKLLLERGQKFSEQIKLVSSPHSLEGSVYEAPTGLLMFCQVGYASFVFINLEDGNRMTDPVAWNSRSTEDVKGGVSKEEVLPLMLKKLKDADEGQLTYIGGITNLIRGA